MAPPLRTPHEHSRCFDFPVAIKRGRRHTNACMLDVFIIVEYKCLQSSFGTTIPAAGASGSLVSWSSLLRRHIQTSSSLSESLYTMCARCASNEACPCGGKAWPIERPARMRECTPMRRRERTERNRRMTRMECEATDQNWWILIPVLRHSR